MKVSDVRKGKSQSFTKALTPETPSINVKKVNGSLRKTSPHRPLHAFFPPKSVDVQRPPCA